MFEVAKTKRFILGVQSFVLIVAIVVFALDLTVSINSTSDKSS